jgi:ABC-2 type transport system permease protein
MRRGRVEVPTRPGGVARPLLPRGPSGRPAGAIVWKNVTGALREFRPRTLVVIAVLVLALGWSLGGVGGAGGLVAVLCLALTAVVVLFGPLALRYDLRRDLELLDVLKSWPIPARDLIAAQVLAPALLVSAVACMGLLGAFVASFGHAALLPVTQRAAYLIAALAAVPAVVLVLLLVQNAAVLLFPAWTTIGPDRATGFEAMGQRILIFVGTVFALFIAVLPATIVGGVVGIAVHALGANAGWTAAAWSVAGAATLAVECYLAVMVLGPVFERLETAGLR